MTHAMDERHDVDDPDEVIDRDPETDNQMQAWVRISAACDGIKADSVFVRALTHGRQGNLGFLTPEGRDEIDEGIRADHADRVRRHQQAHLLLRESPDQGHGYTAPPGNWPAVAVAAQTARELRALIRTLHAHGAGHGEPATDPAAPIPVLAARVDNLAEQLILGDRLATKVLAATAADLEQLNEVHRKVLDGAASTLIPGTCPHCGLTTLVGYFREQPGVIRCGRWRPTARTAGRDYRACVCADPLCHCKANPYAPRHTWPLDPRDKRTQNLGRHLDPDGSGGGLAARLALGRTEAGADQEAQP